MNATALYTPDKCEVWASSQNGEAALAATAEASGLPVAQVRRAQDAPRRRLRPTRRRTDYVTQAVLIAKQMPGTPVKLLWSREEDMTQGAYHPITQCKLTGAFDADNNLTGLHMRISGQSILASPCSGTAAERTRSGHLPGPQSRRRGKRVRLHHPEPADRPRHAQPARAARLLARGEHQPERDLRRVLHGRACPCGRPGSARVPAQADGKHPKHLAVLNAVAERAGWGKPAPQGVYRGLAQHDGLRQLRGGLRGGVGQTATR